MQIRTALMRRTQTTATTDASAIDWAAIYADQLPRVYNYSRLVVVRYFHFTYGSSSSHSSLR